jgi:hypothetical protein
MQTVIEKIFADVQDEISNASDKAVCEILDQLNETASLMVEVLKLQESQNKNRLFTLDVNKAEAAEKSASEAAEEKRPSSPPRF